MKKRCGIIFLLCLMALLGCGGAEAEIGGDWVAREQIWGNTQANINNGGYVCPYGEKVLWTAGGRILCDDELLYTGDGEIGYLSYVNGRIYFLEEGKVYALENGERQDVLPEISVIYCMVTDRGICYEDREKTLWWKEGDRTRKISDHMPVWISFYEDCMYFTEYDNFNHFYAYNMQTGEKKELMQYAFFPALVGGSIVYQDEQGTVSAYELGTGEDKTLYSRWGQYFAPLDDKVFFFMDSKHIYKGDLCGSPVEIIYETEDRESISQLSIAAGRLYFMKNGEVASIPIS